MSNNPLKGKWIVVTRPEHQASLFAKSVQKVGGCLLHFPLIAITALNENETRKKLNELIAYEMLIFVSSNAVEQCIKLIGTEALKNKILVAIGKRTAQTLINHQLSVDFSPERFFNSEALLAVDGFKECSKGKKVAIIRGSSGRDYLKNSLSAAGASVDYFNVYSRYCPQQNVDELKIAWEQNKLDVVLLTSASSTASFFALTKGEDWVNDLTVLIGSSRIQHEIPNHFKGKVLVAEDPSDETLLKKLTLEFK